jgi:hypothetical protein
MIADSDQAQTEAVAEAKELAADSFWRSAYSGAAPTLSVPVENLTPGGTSYFIVDFQKGGRSTGRMVVNSKTGVVDLETGIEVEGEELPKFIVPTDVRMRLTPEVVLKNGKKVNIPTTDATSVVVVWQHCRESHSMLQSFYRVRWPTYELFLRVDGEFFDRLTPTDGSSHSVA